MKKAFDRVWEWMKSTAWFQVLILVGVVVAIVLCISPITKGITGAVSDANRVKYFEYNRISYQETMDKIETLDNGGQEFAVLFVSGNKSSSLEQGIQNYEDIEGSVPIYVLNVEVSETNKDKYNADAKWYDFYKVTYPMIQGFRNGSIQAYTYWQNYTQQNSSSEVSQSSSTVYATPDGADPASNLTEPTLIWFRATKHIDSTITDFYAANPSTNPVTNEAYDYHVAKVYLTIEDTNSGSDNTDVKIQSGLTKFFRSSSLA
jgi:hypothetical protein